MTKLKDIISSVNEACSGQFVGITNYVSDKGDVSSITGHIAPNYQTARTKAIEALETAILVNDFEAITVKGTCRKDGNVFNSRKRSAPIMPYEIEFSKTDVMAIANSILESWKNPKERENNKVELSDKGATGLVYNTETGTVSFSLLVEKQTYKEELSEQAKEGKEEKEENKMPETKLKEIITKRFQKPFKTFVLSPGKFDALTINKMRFKSEELTF